jgi:DNA-binding transcriptional regulator YhcF (GntR family)
VPDGPHLVIDLDGSTPVYRQIANGLRRHLVDAYFKPGDLLPPIRQIALDLGVHFNTVAQAYRILADEGWIDLRRRRGATVLSRDMPKDPDPRHIDSLMRRMADLTTELRGIGMSRTAIAKLLRQAAAGVDR